MIRLASVDDVPLLPAIEASAAQLFAGTAVAHLADGPTTPLAALAQGARSGSLWIADDAGPVGFLLAAATAGWLHIQELSVARTAQGGGHGGALLAAAIAAAPGLGCAQLSLITDRLLPWNAPFYARRGFGEVAAHDAAVPGWLAAKLSPHPGDGLDPARRCIMIRPKSPAS
ncbi:MAG: GNAT family N-acetyltransferase [Sandarakinorhabdus sp.]